MARQVMSAVTVAIAVVLQVILVDRIPLPGGVVPDLVLLTVLALALAYGPMAGLVIGSFAGLVVDIVPPADHTIGQYAFVFCLVGYAAGMAQGELEQSAMLPFGAMAVGVVAANLLYALISGLLGDPRISWASVRHVVPLSVLYDAILSPFVLYAVTRLTRRFGDEDRDVAFGGGPINVDRYRTRQ